MSWSLRMVDAFVDSSYHSEVEHDEFCCYVPKLLNNTTQNTSMLTLQEVERINHSKMSTLL